jgi:hypothetical protein
MGIDVSLCCSIAVAFPLLSAGVGEYILEEEEARVQVLRKTGAEAEADVSALAHLYGWLSEIYMVRYNVLIQLKCTYTGTNMHMHACLHIRLLRTVESVYRSISNMRARWKIYSRIRSAAYGRPHTAGMR